MAVLPGGDTLIANAFANATTFAALIKNDGNEVSGGGYARQSVSMRQSTESGNLNSIVNNGAIDWGTATANWGTVTKVRLYSSASGNTSYYEDTVASTVVDANDSVSIGATVWNIPIT